MQTHFTGHSILKSEVHTKYKILENNFFFFHIDYAQGFGGRYGVQKDRVDKVRLLQPAIASL